MKWGEWLRIVPQLVTGVAGLLACVLTTAPALALDAPVQPKTADEARAFLDRKADLESQGEALLKVKSDDCYQKTLVSGCLREVEQERARFRRDIRATEVAANELLRQERQAIKDSQRPPVQAGQPIQIEKADDPGAPVNVPKTSQSASPKAKPLREAQPDVPTLSPAEQAQRRAQYEAKQREADERELRNRERLAETEAKRARYREQQAKRQQQIDERNREASKRAP